MPRRIPGPRVLSEAAPFWQAANEGRLLVKHCRACGQTHHYPRDICPHCLSEDTEWRTASGQGSVYSFSTMGQGDEAYTIALVTLDEGVTLMTNLIGGDPAAWAVGRRVKVCFRASDSGQQVPMFTAA